MDSRLLKMRIDRIISSAQSLGIFDVTEESKVRIVVEGAGPSNQVQIGGRIKGQSEFTPLAVLTGEDNQVINVFTYEEIQIDCSIYDAVSTEIKIISASFNEAGGAAIDSIGVPSGGPITDIEVLTLTSSDNSVTIVGDNLTKSIDFTTSGNAASYTPSDVTDWSPTPTTVADGLDQLADRTTSLEANKIDVTEKGAPDGVAPLNAYSKIDSTYLPSYVDDIVEVADYAALPNPGETGKIYVTLDTNKIYRWTGSIYIEIAENQAVWGSITGSLASQTDLQSALDGKANDNLDNLVSSSNAQIGYEFPSNITFTKGIAQNATIRGKQFVAGEESGSLSVFSGSTENANSGDLLLNSGNVLNGGTGDSGDSYLQSGFVTGVGQSGDVYVQTGDSTSGNTGDVKISTGDASGSSYAGSIFLNGGSNVDGNPANIMLTAGVSSGTGANGSVILDAKNVVYLNQNPIGTIEASNHRIENVSDPTAPQDAATKKWVEDISAISNVLVVDSTASLFGADGSLFRPFVTIADAVAAAVDGTVIIILPGTYSESQVVVPSTLKSLVFLGQSQSSTIVLNGFSYTTPADYIDVLFEKINVGQFTFDASAALGGLVNLKQCSVVFDRLDNSNNVFMAVTESTIFGGNLAGGPNNLSECLVVASFQVNQNLLIVENTKFVQRIEVGGSDPVIVRTLDCELFGAGVFVHGNGNTTWETDLSTDAQGSSSGVTKVLLANVPLSNITQSGANTDQVPKWDGFAWVPSNLDASITSYTPAEGGNWQAVPSVVSDGLDELAARMVVTEEANTLVNNIFVDTSEPTGFLNRTDSVISFDNPSRTFTIQPTSTSFEFYVKGTKFQKTSADNLTITTADGDHYIYYDQLGNLSTTTTFSVDLIKQNAIVAIVYWNSEINEHVYFAEERHGITMDGETHSYMHTVFGARYLSGLALQGFTVDGAGTSNADAQFTSDSGSIRDEDILHVLPAQSQIPVYYRHGQLWRRKAPNGFPFIYSGTAGYTGASGRIPYNQYTGGAWQLTQIANNAFVLVHYFATNDIDDHVVAIQGTGTYGNVTAARVAAATEISSLSGLPFAEFVPIGSVVLESSNSFSNTPKAIVRSVDGADYVDFRGTQLYTPAGEATTHGLLSGLANDDHTQYLTEGRGDLRYYTKTQIDSSVIFKNGTNAFTADQSMGGFKLTNVANPVGLLDAVNLQTLASAVGSAYDITEKSFSLANSQASAANVTDFVFNNAQVRSFDAIVSVYINATASLYETFEIRGIQKSSDWFISISSEGDNSQVVFSINSSGQIQYTSGNYSGFVSGTVKFRAITTSV